jgi:NDP-sugar pyrophosphorylase family protein
MMEGAQRGPFEEQAIGRCGIVLAGGLGTRIRHLAGGVPKPLIEVAGRPFIEWVLAQLAATGVSRFVISLGHLAEPACRYFACRPGDGLCLTTVREPQPLGTAGAVRFASAACMARAYLVANGDSLVIGHVAGAWRLLEDETVDGVVVGIEAADTSRYGTLVADSRNRLRAFLEKRPGAGLINAGVYLLRRRMIDEMECRVPQSLERDAFPRWLAQGAHILVHRVQGAFLDIGTPETLRQAGDFIQAHFARRIPA